MNDYGNQFRPDGTQFAWNASSLKAWETCPRYYQYTILEGWRRPGDNVHLTFGSHYAKALQRFWLYVHVDGLPREDAIIEVVRLALIESYGWEPEGPRAAVKNRFTLIRTIVWYFDEFTDDLPVLVDASGPAVERQFRVGVDDGVEFVGTFDRVVQYDGLPWIMDQKTTGSTLAPNYFKQYRLDIQMSMYTFASRAVFPDLGISGVIIDAVQTAVGFSRYARGATDRKPSQLQEWYDETMLSIEAAASAVREQRFPRRTTSCHNYGGCVFAEICSKPREVRKNYLRAEFKKEPRDANP